MRFSPTLEWSYRDLWDFIGAAEVPYCSLYEDGSVFSLPSLERKEVCCLCESGGACGTARLFSRQSRAQGCAGDAVQTEAAVGADDARTMSTML
eukprot:3599638-Rhodomonas_salina.1